MKNETQEKICGQRWARILPVYQAAAYTGLSYENFINTFGNLIHDFCGVQWVDRTELDAEIDKICQRFEDIRKS